MDTARLGEVQVENAAGERIRLGSYWKDADALLVFVVDYEAQVAGGQVPPA